MRRSCVVRVQRVNVDRMGLATKREAERLEVKGTVTYDESRVVRRMSIGDRHRLASQLNLAADEIVVPQQCQVSRQAGAVLVCHPGANATADPDIKGVAGRYAGAMAFDLSGLDRDDSQPVLVEIPVRIARSDVRPLSFTGPAMKNGTPSAGAVFGMAAAFKVAE